MIFFDLFQNENDISSLHIILIGLVLHYVIFNELIRGTTFLQTNLLVWEYFIMWSTKIQRMKAWNLHPHSGIYAQLCAYAYLHKYKYIQGFNQLISKGFLW